MKQYIIKQVGPSEWEATSEIQHRDNRVSTSTRGPSATEALQRLIRLEQKYHRLAS